MTVVNVLASLASGTDTFSVTGEQVAASCRARPDQSAGPTLGISRVGATVLLTWPLAAAGFAARGPLGWRDLADRSAPWFTLVAMNWHQLIDERNLELDRVIVSVLRRDPSRLVPVKAWILERLEDPDYSIQSKDGLREWLQLIVTRGMEGVVEMLESRDENAARLRQFSPFAILMPQEERLRILRRYEAFRTRTHPARV